MRQIMKPTNNSVHCAACGKTKMLFETQDNADNFIKSNGGEILEETGKNLTSSYYCELCGGYHVSSIDSKEVGARPDQRKQRRVAKVKKSVELKNRFLFFHQKWKEAWLAIPERIDECDDIIESCELELELIAKVFTTERDEIDKQRKKLDALKVAKRRAERLLLSSPQKQIGYIRSKNHLKTRSVKRMINYLKRILMNETDKLSPEDLLFLSQIV